MRKVDDLMINKYGIELIQMMENAGINLAEFAITMMENVVDKKNQRILSLLAD